MYMMLPASSLELRDFRRPLSNAMDYPGEEESQEEEEPSPLEGPDVGQRCYYDNVFYASGPVCGLLTGDKVQEAFRASGLPQHVLQDIWSLCDVDKDGCLDIGEFSTALYLAQASCRGSHPPRQLSEGLSPQTSERVMLTPMTEDEQLASQVVFARITNGKYISGAEIRRVLQSTGLPPELLARVWDTCDFEGRGQLSCVEFSLLLHLLRLSHRGEEFGGSIDVLSLQPNYTCPNSAQGYRDRMAHLSEGRELVQRRLEVRQSQAAAVTHRLAAERRLLLTLQAKKRTISIQASIPGSVTVSLEKIDEELNEQALLVERLELVLHSLRLECARMTTELASSSQQLARLKQREQQLQALEDQIHESPRSLQDDGNPFREDANNRARTVNNNERAGSNNRERQESLMQYPPGMAPFSPSQLRFSSGNKGAELFLDDELPPHPSLETLEVLGLTDTAVAMLIQAAPDLEPLPNVRWPQYNIILAALDEPDRYIILEEDGLQLQLDWLAADEIARDAVNQAREARAQPAARIDFCNELAARHAEEMRNTVASTAGRLRRKSSRDSLDTNSFKRPTRAPLSSLNSRGVPSLAGCDLTPSFLRNGALPQSRDQFPDWDIIEDRTERLVPPPHVLSSADASPSPRAPSPQTSRLASDDAVGTISSEIQLEHATTLHASPPEMIPEQNRNGLENGVRSTPGHIKYRGESESDSGKEADHYDVASSSPSGGLTATKPESSQGVVLLNYSPNVENLKDTGRDKRTSDARHVSTAEVILRPSRSYEFNATPGEVHKREIRHTSTYSTPRVEEMYSKKVNLPSHSENWKERGEVDDKPIEQKVLLDQWEQKHRATREEQEREARTVSHRYSVQSPSDSPSFANVNQETVQDFMEQTQPTAEESREELPEVSSLRSRFEGKSSGSLNANQGPKVRHWEVRSPAPISLRGPVSRDVGRDVRSAGQTSADELDGDDSVSISSEEEAAPNETIIEREIRLTLKREASLRRRQKGFQRRSVSKVPQVQSHLEIRDGESAKKSNEFGAEMSEAVERESLQEPLEQQIHPEEVQTQFSAVAPAVRSATSRIEQEMFDFQQRESELQSQRAKQKTPTKYVALNLERPFTSDSQSRQQSKVHDVSDQRSPSQDVSTRIRPESSPVDISSTQEDEASNYSDSTSTSGYDVREHREQYLSKERATSRLQVELQEQRQREEALRSQSANRSASQQHSGKILSPQRVEAFTYGSSTKAAIGLRTTPEKRMPSAEKPVQGATTVSSIEQWLPDKIQSELQEQQQREIDLRKSRGSAIAQEENAESVGLRTSQLTAAWERLGSSS